MRRILISAAGSYLDGADVSCDPGGKVRVAAALHGPDGPRVVVWRLEDGAVSEEWISDSEPGLFQVRLVHRGERPLAVAWCCTRTDSRTVLLSPGGTRRVIEGLAEPVPVVHPAGHVVVVGRMGEMIALADAEAREDTIFISVPGGRVFSPAAAVDRDGSLVAAWEQERAPGCCILTRRIEQGGRMGPVLRLDDGDATAHAPGLCPWPDGGVLATWHAPARFDEPQLLVKDARLALVKHGEVLVPVQGSAPDPGEEPRGEEQGFEFPVPVATRQCSVLVLGRGSHCYYSQIVDADGWGARERIDAFEWGCRGPSIRASASANGIWTVTREKGGLALRCIDHPGGTPSFEGRRIVCTGGEGTHVRDRERLRDRDGCCTWFGDLHQHSAFSDGTGAPHETYLRARDFYCDDLAALSDHESFLGKKTPEGEWHYLQDLARRFDEPGEFSTLVAYEWTGKMAPGPGHKVVYYGQEGGPLVSRDDEDTGSGLLAAIGPHGGIAFPHHVGWTGADERSHDPVLQPCFEIVSCHGAYEREDDGVIGCREPVRGPFLRPLLESGLRFGLVGGSDGHGLLWQHGVSRRRDAHRTGFAAVISHDLDPASIMRALRERSVYATSGERIWLRLWVEGVPMGGEVRTDGRVRVEVEIRAGAAIGRACLVLPGAELELDAGGAADWEGHVDVDAVRPGFVYLMVVRSDGECAWSSPVFLD
ncbi:MAG: DUF3604 domain-containing protein [Deltaproteobacteria bacterium]|nr:DUF3604 domain-containing protein [Deltaproteobacteria bacterium]